ncbi:glycosyltransferase family 39 protein [Hydrogenibacillus sp. N12]|uniref:glycosyltransferase family 39 protein n=1 Tax=Hydrogenibacillus sp. N12 TaxID=2866627 RepID=UPI001C7E157B|nr:glycosyltransferase family 39 protein [Hydrogenibacillus sp. N12]QZA32006.1 glycosyltransferase family 39 protein [Hydrogenibacillus sp. N12]
MHGIDRFAHGAKRLTFAAATVFVALGFFVTLKALVQNEQGIASGLLELGRSAPERLALFGMAAAALVGTGVFLFRLRSSVRFVVGLFCFALAIRLIWVASVPTTPVSDFEFMFNMAVKAARGDFSFTEAPYYVRWTYQLPFTLYEALVIKLFGAHPLPLKVLNAFWQSALAGVVYALGRALFGDRAGRAAGLVYALYPSTISTVSVLTNQHPADFFFYLAFCFFLCDLRLRERPRAIATGLALALGELFRPYGPLVLPVIAFFGLFRAAFVWLSSERSASEKRFWPALRKAVIPLETIAWVLIVFWLVTSAAGLALNAAGVTPYSLKSHDPYWKFVVGLNPASSGQYAEEDLRRFADLPTLQAQLEVEKALVLKRLLDVDALLPLFWRKFCILWGSPDATFWWNHGVHRPALEAALKAAERAAFLFVTASAFVGLVLGMRRQDGRGPWPDGRMLLLWIVLGYAAVHLVIEIQVRYRYFALPTLSILAGAGLVTVTRALRRAGEPSARRGGSCGETGYAGKTHPEHGVKER